MKKATIRYCCNALIMGVAVFACGIFAETSVKAEGTPETVPPIESAAPQVTPEVSAVPTVVTPAPTAPPVTLAPLAYFAGDVVPGICVYSAGRKPPWCRTSDIKSGNRVVFNRIVAWRIL